MEDILNLIESIIYMSNSKVNILTLADFCDVSKEKMMEYLLELKEKRDNTGINIKINDNFVYLSTNAKYSIKINEFFNIETKTRKLSPANMEVLSIIAYRGKVTKSEIENIRGVNSDGSIITLLEKNLIYSKERKDSAGKPKLYELTDDFYKYLGLENKEEIDELIEGIKEKNED